MWAFHFDTQNAAEFLEPGRVVMNIALSILSSFLAQLMTLGEERTQAREETNLILACSSFTVLGMLTPSLCLRFPICRMGRLSPKCSNLGVL